jgi:hypothetical protein
MTASIASGAAAVVAHQGGWDEALFVAVPVALFAGLLWRANQKAKRLAGGAHRDDTPHDERDADGGDTSRQAGHGDPEAAASEPGGPLS